MGSAVAILLVGIGLFALGAVVSRAYVYKNLGVFADRLDWKSFAGTGIVPKWASLIVLLGWIVIFAGLVSLIAALA